MGFFFQFPPKLESRWQEVRQKRRSAVRVRSNFLLTFSFFVIAAAMQAENELFNSRVRQYHEFFDADVSPDGGFLVSVLPGLVSKKDLVSVA